MIEKFIRRLFTFDGIVLTGLGCSSVVLIGVILSFFTLWRQFPSAGEATGTEVFSLTPIFPTTAPDLIPPTQNAPDPTASPPTQSPPTAVLAGKIVYVCFMDGFDEICLMDTNGSNATRLTFSSATDFYPSISPDGQSIVFSSRRDNRFEIYEMSLDGRQLTRLTQEVGSAFAPSVSPDGQLIAFSNDTAGNQSIWLMTRCRNNQTPDGSTRERY